MIVQQINSLLHCVVDPHRRNVFGVPIAEIWVDAALKIEKELWSFPAQCKSFLDYRMG